MHITPKYYNLELHLTTKEKDKADEYLKKLKIKDSDMVIGMILAGGITWGEEAKYKHWPLEYYLKIANKLVKKYNARILLFGSRRERFICDKIFNDRIKENVYNLAGQINLRIFAAMLRKCKLAICNDGGPLHVADSQNVTTVSFFGPVDEKIYGPYPPSPKRIVLSKDLPCRPCYKNFKVPECEYNHRCLEEIKVGEVLEKAKNLLQ